ncbi:MAG: MFS transporter [Chloroflexota bacterium]
MVTRKIANRKPTHKHLQSTWSVRLALAGLSLSMLLSTLGTSIVNVALPTLENRFNVSFQEAQWLVIAYLLSITALVVGVGRLGDLTNHRRMLLIGILIFTAASVVSGLAVNFWLLIIGRAVQGIGAAILMALTMALIGEIVSPERTGSAMGLLITMSAIGTALGPPLGGILIEALSWRFIFLINLPLGVLTFFLAIRYLPSDQQEKKVNQASIDYWGTSLLILALIAFTLSMTLGRGNFGLFNLMLLFSAFFGVGLFILVENRVKSPLIQLEMFRNIGFSANLAMNLLVNAVLMATLVVGPFYLSVSLGLTVAQTGFAMAVGPFVAAITSIPAGRLVDRLGSHRIIFIGLFEIIVGSMLLSRLPISLGVPGYLVSLGIMTMGYATFLAANNTAVMKNVLPQQRGVVSGMLNLSRNLGLLTGASAMGAIFALATGTNEITMASPEMVSTGMQLTFAVAAVLTIVATGLGIGSLAIVTRHRVRNAS